MAGPGDKVADIIMMLMQQGGQRGMPMQASPELQAYLQQAKGAVPDAASFDSANVDLMPQRGAGEFVPEHPTPISQDPWFDQMVGEGRPSPRQFQQEGAGNFAQGTYFITMTDPRTGRSTRLDGPFTDEVTAMRELKLLVDAGGDRSKLTITNEQA